MKAEHCTKSGYNVEFKTSNYDIVTTPKDEWEIVVEGKQCPAHHLGYNRKIQRIDALMKTSTAVDSKLKNFEVASVVLYTGPMASSPLPK